MYAGHGPIIGSRGRADPDPRKGEAPLARKKREPGITQIFGSESISKTDPRVRLLGDVDELVAVLGLARSHVEHPGIDRVVRRIQTILLALGAEIADPKSRHGVIVTAEDAEMLYREADKLIKALPPLRNFVIPGGNPGATTLHLARAVCRRAERSAHGLDASQPLPRPVLDFLNGLSNLLFYMARWESHAAGEGDDPWLNPTPLGEGELDVNSEGER